jgi:hypothetical protein
MGASVFYWRNLNLEYRLESSLSNLNFKRQGTAVSTRIPSLQPAPPYRFRKLQVAEREGHHGEAAPGDDGEQEGVEVGPHRVNLAPGLGEPMGGRAPGRIGRHLTRVNHAVAQLADQAERARGDGLEPTLRLG